jgi:hypothetical protein
VAQLNPVQQALGGADGPAQNPTQSKPDQKAHRHKRKGAVGGASGDTDLNAWGGTSKKTEMPEFMKTGYDQGTATESADEMRKAVQVSNSGGDTSRRTFRIGALRKQIDADYDKLKSGKLSKARENEIRSNMPALKQQLNAEIAMAYLANMARETGASGRIVSILNRSSIGIVPDGVMASDGGYDPKTDTIYVSQSMLKMTTHKLAGLLKDGIIDEHKGVTKEGKLKESDAFHNLVVIQALFAHEGVHASEDQSGELQDARKEFRPTLNAYTKAVAAVKADTTLSDTDKAAQIAALDDKFMTDYASSFELDEYYLQEKYQLSQGEAPEQFKLLTVDASGKALAKDVAAKNIVDFMKANKYSAADVVKVFESEGKGGTAVGGASGPAQAPGGPGQVEPGGWHPGGWHPGGWHPGGWHPGGWHPGGWHPGGWHPGGWHPGGWHPGGWHPGGWHPGYALDGKGVKQSPTQNPAQLPAQSATQGATQVQPLGGSDLASVIAKLQALIDSLSQ